jgi:chromosome segregation ATPase
MPVTIRAKNFQSIKNAEIVVDRFTVCTGTNNSGKTALQRAIRGVFQNTGGTAFIREGEKTCEVEVDFGKDGKVKWSKGTGKRDRPTYVVNDGDPMYPGTAVPPEVAAFGVIPIQAGGQDVWPTIAPQFTGQIFLLDRPGSALAEAVADVERVGQLNRALRASESDRRQAAAALKVRLADIVTHEAELQAFDGLDDALAAVTALEGTRSLVANVGRAVNGLTDLRDRLDAARADAEKLAPVAEITVPDGAEVTAIRDELADLRGLRDRLLSARAEVAKYDGINELLVEVDPAPVRRVKSALDVLTGLSGRLRKAEAAVVTRQRELDEAEMVLADAAEAADAALAELGSCPVCGTEMGATA